MGDNSMKWPWWVLLSVGSMISGYTAESWWLGMPAHVAIIVAALNLGRLTR